MPNEIVDTFNVENQDYHFEAPMDNLPVEGSKKAVMSGGVWQRLQEESILNNKQLQDMVFGNRYARHWAQGIGANTAYEMQYLVRANGLWECGSYEHGVWWSEDGKVWTQGTGGNTTYGIQHLVYANGLWVCGSRGHGIWWSEDGKSWTQGTGVASNLTTVGLGFAGNLWLYVGNDTHIYWSEDGKNWTQGESPSLGAGGNAIIRYANGVYVVGSKSSDGAYAWSEDGKNWYSWTVASAPTTLFTVSDFAYDNSLWVAVTSVGLLWSEDGKNWTIAKMVDYSSGFVTYAGGIWLFSGRDGSQRGVGVWWSVDGKTWTQGTGFTAAYIQHPVYTNGLWVCGSVSHGIWWSTDGKSWTQGTGANTSYTMQYIVYANGIWVCGSDSHGMWYGTSFEDLFNVGTPAP